MDDYKVFLFETSSDQKILVLDAIVADVTKKTALLHGFVLNSDCHPFPLFFPEDFPIDQLLDEALEDGSNHVKNIEGWIGEKSEVALKLLSNESAFLNFVQANCKSKKLKRDLHSLLDK